MAAEAVKTKTGAYGGWGPDATYTTSDQTSMNTLFASLRDSNTGGAIKGAVRGDVFFGFGAKPEWNAGHMKAAGAMFVLLPKPLAQDLPAEFAP